MKREVSKRASQALKECGKSYNELAKDIGCTYQTVRNWAVGEREPSLDMIGEIAKATNKDLTWILTGSSGLGDIDLDPTIISIPVINVEASAGFGEIIFQDDQVVKRIDLDKAWIRGKCHFSHPDNLSVITATGDSMEPTISHGDFLLVDQGIDSIRSDSIYVASVNGNLYVKRFQLTPRNTYLMLSDNPRYKEFEVNPNADDVRVIGKIIYHWHGEAR